MKNNFRCMNNSVIKSWLQKTSFLFVTIYLYACNTSPKQNTINELINVYSKDIPDSLKANCAVFIRENMSDLTSEKALFYNRKLSKINIRLDTISSEGSLLSVISRNNLICRSEVLADSECIDSELLKSNIHIALASWNRYPWSQNVPKDIFLDYLLPYKVFDEYSEDWRRYFLTRYKDSIVTFMDEFLNDSTNVYNTDPNQIYYKIIVEEAEKWFKYSNDFTKLTTSPSLSELLCIKKGGCYEASLLNVYILRSLGIPATVDIVPLWGSKNGAHASEVFWNNKDRMRTASGREFEKPAKVFRLSFKRQNVWANFIKPYVDEEHFLLHVLKNDHVYDVTEEHGKVLTLEIPIQSENSQFAYICVYNYGKWQPVFWGKIDNGKAKFKKMGYPMLYQVALPDNQDFKLMDRIFMVDSSGNISYPKINWNSRISVILHKMNSGDFSYVKKGKTYALEYLDINERWATVGEKTCEQDSVISFNSVPSKGLLRLVEATGKKKLERIFTYENDEQVWW